MEGKPIREEHYELTITSERVSDKVAWTHLVIKQDGKVFVVADYRGCTVPDIDEESDLVRELYYHTHRQKNPQPEPEVPWISIHAADQ